MNPTIELSNESLTICSFLINDNIDHDTLEQLKTRAIELDEKEIAEEKLRRVYRPPDIDLTESSDKEMRIVAGPNEHYAKGSEVYMSYGRNSNRQLLSVYGFSLRQNRFNFAIFFIQLKNLMPSIEISDKLRIRDFTPDHFVKFKLKEKVLCSSLVKMVRKLW